MEIRPRASGHIKLLWIGLSMLATCKAIHDTRGVSEYRIDDLFKDSIFEQLTSTAFWNQNISTYATEYRLYRYTVA